MGSAMGTSSVVNYSYLYAGLLGMKCLLVDYKEHLLFSTNNSLTTELVYGITVFEIATKRLKNLWLT